MAGVGLTAAVAEPLLPELAALQPPGTCAELLALGGVAPYDGLWQAGLPLPPAPAAVRALPGLQFAREQLAMKKVWLARALRAKAERNRISRENWQACAKEAQAMGAPEGFVQLLNLRAADTLPRPQRYMADAALSHWLELYRVDEREIRYFTESRALPRGVPDADWFPLPLLFNTEEQAGVSLADVAAHDISMLSALGEMTLLYQSVHDRESADAAAAALPQALARFRSAGRALNYAPEERRQRVRARYARLAEQVERAWAEQRKRVMEAEYWGAERLRALDFFAD